MSLDDCVDDLATTSSMDDDDTIGFDGCDESKCVSWSRQDDFDRSFTCYATTNSDIDDGAISNMMCADGFFPRIVIDDESDGFPQLNNNVSYFTCCPPLRIASANSTGAVPRRQCSDPIQITGNGIVDTGVCDDHHGQRKYPRRMKTKKARSPDGTPYNIDSIVCCDAPLPDDANFEETVDCVPYRSRLYEVCDARNFIGSLAVRSCDFPDGAFTVPRPLEGKTYMDATQSRRYQCCRTGTPLEPFIKDVAFEITVFLPLALFSFAVVISMVLIIALLIPLFFEGKNGLRSRRTPSGHYRPRYSTYNLYLVYLALFDLMWSLSQIGILSRMINQKHNLGLTNHYAYDTIIGYGTYGVSILYQWDISVSLAYFNVNMWINVFISYQLLLLLRKSQTVRRTGQPSLQTVNLQVGFAFLISIGYYLILYTLQSAARKAERSDDFTKFRRIAIVVYTAVVAHILVPLVITCGIAFWIWWADYLPSKNGQTSVRDGAMRQLFFFFLRVILVFVVVWIPFMLFPFLDVEGLHWNPAYYLALSILAAVQPILSACMILMKFDVRKYVMDLITLSYCCGE